MHNLIYLSFVFLLLGCTLTNNRHQSSIADEARIWVDQTASLEVLEATSGEGELYIRFRATPKDSETYKTFTAMANWDPSKPPENMGVPLTIIAEEIWTSQGAHLDKIRSLSENDWRDFRSLLAHAITPQEPLSGVVITGHEEELVLFYDEEDHLQVLDLREKPVAIQIKENFTQEKFSAKVVQSMQEYLTREKIDAPRVLFIVDNDDDYTCPFLFVDLDKKLVLNLHLPRKDQEKYRQGLIKKGIKSADYLLFDSYVLGMVKRPVSSSLRLFSWAQGLPRDMIKPPSLDVFASKAIPPLYEGEPMDSELFNEKLSQHLGKKSSSGSIQFLIGGDEFFPRLIDAIIGAKRTIDVRIFIFDNDDYALSIAKLLKKRANEGIKVRVLLDGMGQVMGETAIPETLPPGYVPPESMSKYLREDSQIEVRVRPNAWFKADHTKTIIVDEEMFFTGGMNIGREYRYHWHDLMMNVRGPVIKEIMKEFEIAWAHAGPWGDLGYLKTLLDTSAPLEKDMGYPIQTMYTKLNDPQIYKAQLLAIKEAKKYIYVHNPYFSDDAIIYELIKARRRGVDVRVILPFSGNHEIMNASNVVSANTLYRNGVRVFFYPGMSHVKAAVYDGWLCAGSANLDKLSLIDNLELNVSTADPDTVKDILRRLFDVDFKRSMEMKEPLAAGWKERLAEFVAEQL